MWTLIVIGVLILALVLRALKVVQQYEVGLLITFGKVDAVLNPGLHFVIPFVQRLERINLQVMAESVDPQQVITKDNVSLLIQAAVYYRVNDPRLNYVQLGDDDDAITLFAQTSLRETVGGSNLEQLLEHSEQVGNEMLGKMQQPARQWGIEIISVKLVDIKLPEELTRAMASVAEARITADARKINAQGERDGASLLAEAAELMSPAALELRRLRTYELIGAENSTVIVVPGGTADLSGAAAAGSIAAQNQG